MSAVRAILGFAGLGLMAYAAYGLVTADGMPTRQVLFAAALVVGHEGILMPLAIGVGWVALRVVPPWARAAAQVALVVTLALTIVAVPMIVLAGSFPDLPSLLPRDYRRGLLIAVGITWLVALASAVVNRRRSRLRALRDDG
jgi:hypothetical protein